MKKNTLKLAVIAIASSIAFTSCIGSFNLFNKYEKWQCNMSGSKILNGVVGLILQPIAAPVCLVIDALVLNTIEFWSGSNPVTASTKQVVGSDGKMYAVKSTENGYEITNTEGETTTLKYNKENNSWSIMQDGETQELFRINEDGTIEATLQTGQKITVTNDMQGLYALQNAVESNYNTNLYALR